MKGMVIDGVFASEHVDTSGEILDVKGCDISDLVNGVGVLNFEHNDKSPADILGKITFAKKIYKESDCDNERELAFWRKVKVPFIYGQAELFDADGHPGAVAAAAIIRYYHRRSEPLLARFSIEGATMARDNNRLVRSVARKVALTLKPCNRSCFSGVVFDDMDKVEAAAKTEKTLARGTYYETDLVIIDDNRESFSKNEEEFTDLFKALDPSQVILDHYSSAPDLETIDPSFHGKGISGAEAKRKMNDPKNFVDRSYYYEHDTKPEDSLAHHKKYHAVLPKGSTIYDLRDDPHGFIANTPNPGGIGVDYTALERKIKEAGFIGYKHSGSALPNAVAIFHPLKTVKLEDLGKALEAGVASGAPSSLSQGAALQSEEFAKEHGKHKNNILAAFRDWDRTTPISKFLKNKIPDASEKYLDYFAGLVDDYQIKKAEALFTNMHQSSVLRKAARLFEELVEEANLAKKAKVSDVPFDVPSAGAEEIAGLGNLGNDKAKTKKAPKPKAPHISVRNPMTLTRRGEELKPNPDIPHNTKSTLDPDEGVLRTPRMSVELVAPKGKAYTDILDKEISPSLDRAAKYYKQVEALDELPPDLIATASLMGITSAKTPVNENEKFFAQVRDACKAHGIKLNSPEFAKEILPGGKLHTHIMTQDTPESFPELSRQYFEQHPEMRLKAPGKLTGRAKGDVIKTSHLLDTFATRLSHLPEQMKRISELHRIHGKDGRAIAEAMMNEKAAGLYPMSLGGGQGPKVARFHVGLGAKGNVIVPDTHRQRVDFNFDTSFQKDGKFTDADALAHAKEVLWDPKNSHLLNSYDKWFHKNHPAVKWVQDRYYGGENTEQALMLAHWASWGAGPMWEKLQGISSPEDASNLTSHEPYWDAIDEDLRSLGHPGIKTRKAEPEPDGKIDPISAAMMVNRLEQKYGSSLAQMVFFSDIVPHMLPELKEQPELQDMPTQRGIHRVCDPEGRHLGRFATDGKEIVHLEDHDGTLADHLPEGEFTGDHQKRIGAMMDSGYKVTKEADLPGEAAPDTDEECKYYLSFEDSDEELELILRHDSLYLPDGSKLSEEETEHLLAMVDGGEAFLRVDEGDELEQPESEPESQPESSDEMSDAGASEESPEESDELGDKIPGGLAEGKERSDFDPEALAEGADVETEHTTDPKVAEEIAADHLTEDPKYYNKLKEMEKKKK